MSAEIHNTVPLIQPIGSKLFVNCGMRKTEPGGKMESAMHSNRCKILKLMQNQIMGHGLFRATNKT